MGPPNAAPRRAAQRCAALQNSANVAPLEAARRVKILFFGMLIMHGGEFFTTRDSSGYRDWPQSKPKKRRAVKDKLFPAFISRRGAAWRSSQCIPCNDKQYS